MPVRRISQSLAAPGSFLLVRDGNVINGLNVKGIPAGVSVFLKLGNNERIGPIDNGPFVFGPGTAFSDVSEGVWLETDAAFPGVVVTGFVSYRVPGGLTIGDNPGVTSYE